jgi:hypothetical protein
MGSGLLGGAEGGGAGHEFDRALAEGRVADAAALAVVLVRLRPDGLGATAARVQRIVDADGLADSSRVRLASELAVLQARAGRLDRALATMTRALLLAERLGDPVATCEAELRGAYFAIQVGQIGSAHDLLDNAEASAVERGDGLRLGFARIVRGIAALSDGATGAAVELIEEGVGLTAEADEEHRAWAQRQHARALVRGDWLPEAAGALEASLGSALYRCDEAQAAECLETMALLAPREECSGRALGAAAALRRRAASARWPDEEAEVERAIVGVRLGHGFDRAAELALEGRCAPGETARSALVALALYRGTSRTR